MKNLILIILIAANSSGAFGQVSWKNLNKSNETLEGVIKVDSSYTSQQIMEAFLATHPKIQAENILTKTMQNLSTFSAVMGDYSAMVITGLNNHGNGSSNYNNTATVKFIDGYKAIRFYYNVKINVKDGKYKLTIAPIGSSGYAMSEPQTTWKKMFKSNGGEVKSIWAGKRIKMLSKTNKTIQSWMLAIEEELNSNSDW